MARSKTTQWFHLGSALMVLMLVGGSLTGCSQMMTMMHGGATPPAPGEFGLGPRTSSTGLYKATLQPSDPLKPRKMLTVQVVVTDAQSRPVDGAAITIDGGMPQHGHGLPTKPRVTKASPDGRYLVEGVRFNMGGWWELKLAITGPAGTDTVTFNLAL